MKEIDRTKFIGGSDVHHIFSLEPYGCARLLWYEKTGHEPDYPPRPSKAMIRGTRLEAVAVEEYEGHTARKTRRLGQKFHPEHGFMEVQVDRMITKDGEHDTPGYLEIKVPGQWAFKKIEKEGLPDSYILQVQHGLGVLGWDWGAYGIFWPDGWEMREFDIERDEPMIAEVQKAELGFWKMVHDLTAPGRLPAGDKRCQQCPMRRTCWGDALIPAEDKGELEFDAGLVELVQEYFDTKEAADEADGALEKVKARLRGALRGRDAVETEGARIYNRQVTQMRWDTKALEAEHPELAKAFKRPRITVPLRIFPI